MEGLQWRTCAPPRLDDPERIVRDYIDGADGNIRHVIVRARQGGRLREYQQRGTGRRAYWMVLCRPKPRPTPGREYSLQDEVEAIDGRREGGACDHEESSSKEPSESRFGRHPRPPGRR